MSIDMAWFHQTPFKESLDVLKQDIGIPSCE